MANLNEKIVILTGAGISAESGVKTFRDHNGLWEEHNIYEVATPEAFQRNPDLVHRFYNQRRKQLLSDQVKPNGAHTALAKLEKEFPGEVVIVTQNVDDLHERGGSKNVLHMHGEILKAKCKRSGRTFKAHDELSVQMICECCNKPGNLRPDIVWFGESVYHLAEIEEHLRDCTIFMSIGTSGNVFPANHFVSRANAKKIEVNLEKTEVSYLFDRNIYGLASKTVPKLVDELLK